MKKVDIREIGKNIVIDMNTLTDKAYVEVDKLTTAYYQLLDYKEYLWKNGRVEIVDDAVYPFQVVNTNHDEMRKTWIELETIELDLYRIIKDSKNFKGFTFKKLFNTILDSNYLNLTLAGIWAYMYVDACINQNIVGAMCDGYLVMHYSLAFNTKRILEVK